MKKLQLKEKTLYYTKKTKPHTNKHVIITAICLALFICVFTLFENILAKPASIAEEKQNDDILTAAMVGDIMMGRHLESVTARHGSEYLFRYLKDFLRETDYVTGNFEHPVTNSSEYDEADKNIHLSTDHEAVETLNDVGFTVLTLANNHTMDYLEEGYHDTVDAFEKGNLSYVGIGDNLEQLQSVHYETINDLTVATLGFTDIAPGPVSQMSPGVIPLDPELFMPLIAEAREQADLVFVHAHWGQEYDSGVTTRQRELAKAMSDAGADVIIGHHPHVLSSFDVYNDTVIFYSLGNFIFDQGWSRNKDSAIVHYTLTESGEGLFEITPLRMKEGTPRPTSNPYYKSRIFRALTKHTSDSVNWKKKGSKIIIAVDHTCLLKSE